MKKIWFLAIIGVLQFQSLAAQINWSVNVGGGVTFFERVFNDYPWPNYEGGAMFQAGTSISSLFGKESMVGWEIGLQLTTTAYTLIPEKKEDPGQEPVWDYDNKEVRRNWFIQLPVSLTFNMFEGTGFLLGARMNQRLTNLDTYPDDYRKWIPAAHIGIFTQITPRIRVDVTAFMDIPERFSSSSSNPGLRELGGSLNIRYILNQ